MIGRICSERNVVVGARPRLRAHVLVGRNGGGDVVRTAVGAGSQLLRGLRHVWGAVPLRPLLVLPLARADAALDVDLPALGEVLAADLGLLAPDHDPMPLRDFLLLPALVGPALGGGQAQVGHRLPRLRVAHLGVRAEIADQDDLVDAAHARLLVPGAAVRGSLEIGLKDRLSSELAQTPAVELPAVELTHSLGRGYSAVRETLEIQR